MNVQISDLYAVAYMNGLTGKIDVYSKLFDNKEEAQKLADEFKGVVKTVLYSGSLKVTYQS